MDFLIKQYRDDIREFQDAMEYKLTVHAKKGHWSDADIDDMFTRLEGEVLELADAISKGNSIEVILEAADVANFAMIIQWLARHGNQRKNFHEDRGTDPVAHGDDNTTRNPSGAPIYGGDVLPSDD